MSCDRVNYIVAVSIKGTLNPYQNRWPGFVRKMVNTKFFATERTIQGDIQMLLSAWTGDKWAELIKINPYVEQGVITKEMVETWEQSYKRESCIL